METNHSREELHSLLDGIPDGDIPIASRILRALADPVRLALRSAPSDNEKLSAHEQAAWDADQRRRLTGSPPLSNRELLKDLGFSEADFQ